MAKQTDDNRRLDATAFRSASSSRLMRIVWNVARGICVLALSLGGSVQVTTGQETGSGEDAIELIDQGLSDPALVGALDTHAHMNPDSPDPGPRGIDVIDYARRAKDLGMRGFVIKQQYDQTAQLAATVRKLIPDIEVFGSIVLSRLSGGISAEAVRHMAEVRGGWGRIVWMPTLHADGNVVGGPNPPYVKAVSSDGELLPEVTEVLEVIATTRTVDSNGELVLAVGHLQPEVALMVLREARDIGVQHMVVTHGTSWWQLPQLQEAVELGAFVEVRAGFELIVEPSSGETDPRMNSVGLIRALGVEHCILASDLGQVNLPVHTDGLSTAAQWLRSQGFTDQDLNIMMKENPARLLGLPLL